MSLPTDRDARNALPIWDGVMMYFPDVWAEIAKVSVLGNKQHNLGAKLFWNRDVSTDHLNKVMRHCLDHGSGAVLDTDGTFHMAKAVWRACAELQLAIEAQRTQGAAHTSDNYTGPNRFKAMCCKCGKVDYYSEPVEGLYFCDFGCA